MASITEKAAFLLYDLAWKGAVPFLSRNKRMAEGLDQRKLKIAPPRSDVWIQAASAGESYLARSILDGWVPPKPLRVLATSNTRQGMDILDEPFSSHADGSSKLKIATAYFPFDSPSIMKRAVRAVRPSVMVLLESEIWPGLLSALKETGCKILIVNGRINQKSLDQYRIWPSVWKNLAPDRISAVSEEDARRFAMLFGKDRVRTAPNIKFDRIGPATAAKEKVDEIRDLVGDRVPFLVLASVRKEEEPFVESMIAKVLEKMPETVVGLFPRHMHRLSHWRAALDRLGVKWKDRSETVDISPGEVLLWDTFGELTAAFFSARAVFIGGSLAPVGGQNFLEPLTCGIVPVMGPSWFNFYWVGEEIMETGLVKMAGDWRQAADALVESLRRPADRERVREEALAFIRRRRGGTKEARRIVEKLCRL